MPVTPERFFDFAALRALATTSAATPISSTHHRVRPSSSPRTSSSSHLGADGIGMVEDLPVNQVMHAGGPDFDFVPRDLPQREARRIFQRSADENGAPLMAMLITKTGKQHEPRLGILTPWDLPALTPALAVD